LIVDLHASKIAGLDEVGRGAWAGPICAGAAVVVEEIPKEWHVRDSKLIPEEEREDLAARLKGKVAYGIGEASAEEIDTYGLGWANRIIFIRAINELRRKYPTLQIAEAWVDGKPINRADFSLGCPHQCVVQGESSHMEIACAAILAKTHRDGEMRELDRKFPGYGLISHKGYGTKAHREAIASLGPVTGLHRMSFSPLKTWEK